MLLYYLSGGNLVEVERGRLYPGIYLLDLAALQNTPQEEVIVALKQINQVSVAVKMITGDSLPTARAIAAGWA